VINALVQGRVRASSRRLVPRWAKEFDWHDALNKSSEERVEHLRAGKEPSVLGDETFIGDGDSVGGCHCEEHSLPCQDRYFPRVSMVALDDHQRSAPQCFHPLTALLPVPGVQVRDPYDTRNGLIDGVNPFVIAGESEGVRVQRP
jgi:hypothetical protein